MSGRRGRRLVAQINVVPYIDVMMVLLVIFMVTAPMITPGQVDLPSVARTHNTAVEPMQVTIHADGDMTVRDEARSSQDQPVTLIGLQAVIAQKQQEDPDQAVVIAADRNVRYEKVMQVMSLMQRNAVRHVGLLAEPETTRR